MRFLLFFTAFPMWCIVIYLNIVSLMDEKWYFDAVLICISFIMRNFVHLSIYSYSICFLSGELSVHFLCSFSIGLLWWWSFRHQVMSDSLWPHDCILPGFSVHGYTPLKLARKNRQQQQPELGILSFCYKAATFILYISFFSLITGTSYSYFYSHMINIYQEQK